MAKFPLLENILTALKSVLAWLDQRRVQFWLWLRLRVPIFEALVQRHVRNPATVFVDVAVAVLAVYFLFGSLGYWSIYVNKSETRRAEVLSYLYPLPAARVDNSFIWSHQFLLRLRFLNNFQAQAPQDLETKPPTDSELRQQILDGLVEDKVVFLEAQKRSISVTSSEVDAALEKQGDVSEVKAKIAALYGMSLGEFKDRLAEQILKEKVKNTVLARVRIRHILATTLPAAQEAKKQLGGGKPFADVAKELSSDSQTKDAGGDLGYWHKGELASQISPGFEDEVFKLTVNQVSDPIQTKFGFHLVEVTERTGDSNQTYQEWLKGQLTTHKVRYYLSL